MIIFSQKYRGDNSSHSIRVLCLGGSGTGKTYNFIIPNIEQSDCKMVIADPTHELIENFKDTHSRLSEKIADGYIIESDTDLNGIAKTYPFTAPDNGHKLTQKIGSSDSIDFITAPIDRSASIGKYIDKYLQKLEASAEPYLLVLDEFANIGRIDALAAKVPAISSMSLIATACSLSQIKALYEDEADAVVNLFDYIVYMSSGFGSGEPDPLGSLSLDLKGFFPLFDDECIVCRMKDRHLLRDRKYKEISI